MARVVREARKRRRTTARRTKAEAPKRATLRLVEPEYRKMLVAVDGSSTSEAALAAAVALTRALSGRLRVLHVVDSPYDYPDVMYGRVPGDREELGEAWHKAGQEVLDWAVALARQGGCEPEPSLIEGNGAYTSQHIVEAARVWGADLIVVGRNGRRGLSRLLLGSVAEGVARAAPVPVLLVRATGTRSPIVHDDPTDRAAARGAAGLTRRTEDIRMEAETPLDAPVAKVMTRAVVLMLEGIPMSEARAIAVQYDYNGFPIVTQIFFQRGTVPDAGNAANVPFK